MTRDAHDPTCCAWCSKAGTPCQPGDVAFRATAQARDAAWTLGALDGTSGPRDRTHDNQETDMDYRTPDQKRHDETLAALHEIRDAVLAVGGAKAVVIPKPKLTFPDMGATLTPTPDDDDEPADITEEPCKRGCDRDDLGMAHSAGMTCCDTCGTERPLNSICPACEPAPADDLPGEPVEPGDLRAGDRVAYTYRWKRYEGALVVSTMRRQPITTLEHAGLLVTFEGRWAGGISDVRLIERAPVDVDPDEALAKALWKTLNAPMGHPESPASEGWLNVARAARKHIGHEVQMGNARALADMRVRAEKAEAAMRAEVKDHDATRARADKAEADLARVTKERDRLTHLLGSHADGHRCTCEMIDPGKPGIEPPSWEQDPWCLTHPDMDVIVAEVKALKAKADRYDALRADVEALHDRWHQRFMDLPDATKRHAVTLSGCATDLGDALSRDTERAES